MAGSVLGGAACRRVTSIATSLVYTRVLPSALCHPYKRETGQTHTALLPRGHAVRWSSGAREKDDAYLYYNPRDPEPIKFSQTEAAKHGLDPMFGDHRITRKPKKTVYVLMAFGVVLCSALLYNFITADVETPEENEARTLAEIKKMEDMLAKISTGSEGEEEKK